MRYPASLAGIVVNRLSEQPLKGRVFDVVFLERSYLFHPRILRNGLRGRRSIRNGVTNGIAYFGVTRLGLNQVNIIEPGLHAGQMKSFTRTVLSTDYKGRSGRCFGVYIG
jgi:hypothetical protein